MEGLAQKEREAALCLEVEKKVPRLGKILVAPKILEGDLFLCLLLLVFPKQDIVLKIKTED